MIQSGKHFEMRAQQCCLSCDKLDPHRFHPLLRILHLKKIEQFILKKNIVNKKEIDALKNKMQNKVLNSWTKALSSKDQIKSDLFKFVYHD